MPQQSIGAVSWGIKSYLLFVVFSILFIHSKQCSIGKLPHTDLWCDSSQLVNCGNWCPSVLHETASTCPWQGSLTHLPPECTSGAWQGGARYLMCAQSSTKGKKFHWSQIQAKPNENKRFLIWKLRTSPAFGLLNSTHICKYCTGQARWGR